MHQAGNLPTLHGDFAGEEQAALICICSHSAGSNNMDGYRIMQVGHDFVVRR
jgi:hypothetical protein